MRYLPLVLIASARVLVQDLEGVTEGLTDDDLSLDYDTVARIASLPLHCHSVEFPNKLSQVLDSESDLLPPRGQCLFKNKNPAISHFAPFRTPSDLLWLLRLAQLCARPLAAGPRPGHVPRSWPTTSQQVNLKATKYLF